MTPAIEPASTQLTDDDGWGKEQGCNCARAHTVVAWWEWPGGSDVVTPAPLLLTLASRALVVSC